jgi:copper chaperone
MFLSEIDFCLSKRIGLMLNGSSFHRGSFKCFLFKSSLVTLAVGSFVCLTPALACEHGEKSASGDKHQCLGAEGKNQERGSANPHRVQMLEGADGHIELRIKGLACNTCVARLEAALKAVKGVKSAKVSLEQKTARIEVSSADVRKKLEQAARDAGFEPEAAL